jgi:hypothetical protein
MRLVAMVALVALTTIAGCSDDPAGTVNISLGEESDALSRTPAPTTLVVETLGLDRTKNEVARVALPASSDVSLGDLPRSDVGALAVTGLDAAGKVLLRGETLYLQWGALENLTLDVFLQRTGELARVPRGPSAFDAKVAIVAVGRYVLAASDTSTYLYDLLNLRPLENPPVLPRNARSLVTFDTTAIVIDETGADLFDLQLGRRNDLAAPTGASFAEIAGGATVRAPDGTQFIVGPTRTAGGPTQKILKVSPEGTVTALSIAVAREGACAAWVEGRGLIVYGGSASAPGGEIIAPTAQDSSGLPFPADDVRACGATALDGSHVLVAGEEARVLDLACAADCKPVAWPGTLDLVRAEAFTLFPDAALVVGDDASGNTKAIRASNGGPREVPLKTPRRGAHLVALPQDGYAAIVGGGAPGIEQYVE